MSRKSVYIIAEVGPNHQGSLTKAKKYVSKLASIGVDAVKFQIGQAEEHYSLDSIKPKYQKKNIKNDLHIIQQAKKRLLNFKDHLVLADECKKFKVDYICSAFDLKSLKFLTKNINFPYYKIPSAEIVAMDCLKYIAKKNKPIILSTGMASKKEIKFALKILNKFKRKKIVILHCVSSYPTNLKNLNLDFMLELKKLFKYPVGLSDHTIGELASIAAAANGASIIEKHVTFDRSLSGPDHKASMKISDFKILIQKIRTVEEMKGRRKKIITKDEKSNSKALRKSCVAGKNLKIGDQIKLENLNFKRPGFGISPVDVKKILNKKVKKEIKKDRLIKISNLK